MSLDSLGDDRETSWDATRAQAVDAVLRSDRVFVFGDDEEIERLVRWASHHLVRLGDDVSPGATDTVLILGLDHLKEGLLLEPFATTWLLVPTAQLAGSDPDSASSAVARVRAAVAEQGAVAVDVHRLLRRDVSVSVAGLGRLARLDAETPELLVSVHARTEEAVGPLEDHLRMIERELEVMAQQQVAHARTREAERLRAERLEAAERQLREVEREQSVVEPSPVAAPASPVPPPHHARRRALTTLLRRALSKLRRVLSGP